MKAINWMALGAMALTAAVSLAAPPSIPPTPAAAAKILFARPFSLEQAYTHDWRAENERPQVTSGWLLVLEVNPDLVYPRQTAEPVLYVGNQTAERVNIGYQSGRVVAIVPGDVDLSTALVFFGTPELPERVTANAITQQTEMASNAGIRPFSKEQVQKATKAGGERLTVKEKTDLLPVMADLVEKYAPQEKYIADSMRGPSN
jgi:hypothetical protein